MLWWTTQNLVITALLAGIAWCACRALRAGPVWRHALWMVVLVKLLTPPLVFWPWAVRDPLRLGDGPASVAAKAGPAIGAKAAGPGYVLGEDGASDPLTPDADSALDPSVEVAAPDAASHAAIAAPPLPPGAVSSSAAPAGVAVEPVVRYRVRRLLPWLGSAWIAGAAAVALLQCVRIIQMLRLLRRGRPGDAALLRHVEVSARRLGIRPVAVRVVPGIGSPVIWALARPLLLWPEELPAGVGETAVRGLVVHELAHVKRRDHWVGWLELLAGCAWWWDPLFWYVRHQLRENAELACDAWVVSALAGREGEREGRRAYAEALLAVCECASNQFNRMSRTAPMPAVGVTTGGRRFLERRLAMILRDRAALRLPRLGFLSLGLMALCTLPAWAQKAPVEAVPPVSGSAAIGSEGTVHVGVMGSRILRDGTVTVDSYTVPALPKDAREVLDQMLRSQAEARGEASRKIAQARADTIRELKQLQDGYTKAGQLDEAVAVRAAVRRLQAEGGATRYSTVRRLYPPNPIAASGDPGNLTAYRDRVGQSFYFDVTGTLEGTVWGNVIYTDDSALAAAAVHAGVLAPGQRGVVKVTILPGRDSFVGSESNGVKSLPYAQWPGSYSVEAAESHRSGYSAENGLPGTSSMPRDYRPMLVPGSGGGTGSSSSPAERGAKGESGTGTGGAGINRERTVADLINLARKLIDNAQYREAIGVVDQILALEPRNDYAIGVRPLLEDKASQFEQRQYRGGGGSGSSSSPAEPGAKGESGTDTGGSGFSGGGGNGSSSSPPKPGSKGESGAGTSAGSGISGGAAGSSSGPAEPGGKGESGAGTGAAQPLDPASAADNLFRLRDHVGQSFVTTLTGSADGKVWGTDVYTDDSSPAAAAVHAGVLHEGEAGLVKITILAGQGSYQGSDRNGVTSESWPAWEGSFRIERHGDVAKEPAPAGATEQIRKF